MCPNPEQVEAREATIAAYGEPLPRGEVEGWEVDLIARRVGHALLRLTKERDEARKSGSGDMELTGVLEKWMVDAHVREMATPADAVLAGQLMRSHERLRERVEELERERDDYKAELGIMEHKVVACGVAAHHSDPNLTRTYPTAWQSPQLEDVRALRVSLAAAEIDRDRAIAHDRQPYPTADAYARVCIALENHKAQLAAAREALDWIVGDAAYKAPEQMGLTEQRWLSRVRAALDGLASGGDK